MVVASEPILIKRYENRKLYDSSRSTYVTLEEIAGMIRGGKRSGSSMPGHTKT